MTPAPAPAPDAAPSAGPSLTTITVAVLVGGLGTRLQSSVPDRPKFLAPVADRPFAAYLLDLLRAQGVRDVVLCVGHRAGQVEDFCGDGARWGLAIRYSREASPLGTGGALREARHLLRSETFIALNGDSFIAVDLARLLEARYRHGGLGTIVVSPVDDASRFGCVEIDPSDRVTRFVEKGARGPGWVNAGVYALSRDLVDRIPDGVVSLEREVFGRLPAGALSATRVAGPLIDIGTPASLAEAAETLPALVASALASAAITSTTAPGLR